MIEENTILQTLGSSTIVYKDKDPYLIILLGGDYSLFQILQNTVSYVAWHNTIPKLLRTAFNEDDLLKLTYLDQKLYKRNADIENPNEINHFTKKEIIQQIAQMLDESNPEVIRNIYNEVYLENGGSKDICDNDGNNFTLKE